MAINRGLLLRVPTLFIQGILIQQASLRYYLIYRLNIISGGDETESRYSGIGPSRR